MKDKILIYAIAISIVLHIVGVLVIGRTSASKLSRASVIAPLKSLINVDLVRTPDEAVPKPKPVIINKSVEDKVIQNVIRNTQPNIKSAYSTPTKITIQPNVKLNHKTYVLNKGLPGNPGGKLTVGSVSEFGDISGNWSGGRTLVGTVPGDERGKGIGSGDGPGRSNPDPPKDAFDGPNANPSPQPSTPASRKVQVRVCSNSGMLPGEYCNDVITKTFDDGEQPTRVCNKCKPPEPVHVSRTAEQTRPVLIRDSRPSVSVDEPCSVQIQYTVTADGDVTDVQVLKSSGNRNVDKAVVSAALKMKYKPATQDGVPRSVKMTRTYSFG